jgi:hypothetical protein
MILFSPSDKNPIFNVKFSLLSFGHFVITFPALYKEKYRVAQRMSISNFPKQKYVESKCEISLKIHGCTTTCLLSKTSWLPMEVAAAENWEHISLPSQEMVSPFFPIAFNNKLLKTEEQPISKP